MRSVRLLALVSAILATAPAFAQRDGFPDVPTNHWAYEALARMKKDGLLVGYPDSLYRGGRPVSRYEMAVAMHAVWTNLRNVTEGLDAQIRALQGSGNADGVGSLKDALSALRGDLAALKGFAADIADLQRATDTFELELNQLGVNVQAMKDSLKALGTRVRALEAKKPTVEIHGDLNLWVGGGHTADGKYGLTRDGRLTGTRIKGQQNTNRAVGKAGIVDDAAFLSEAAFAFDTTNDTGPRVHGTVVLTNMFGQGPERDAFAFGNQSDVFNPTGRTAGLYGYAEGRGDVYLENLYVSFEGPRLSLEAGRVEHRATPWILQRIDNTLYFDSERWDNGLYGFEGVVARGHLGPVGIEAYGGSDNDLSVKGVEIDPLRSNPIAGFATGARIRAERLLGGAVTGRAGRVKLRGDVLVLDADDDESGTVGGRIFDQVQVYGGEADFRVGRFWMNGGVRQSQAYRNDDRLGGATGTAWDAKAAWSSGTVDLALQYREVQTDYAAPGDWGRLGILRNPTNVRGFVGKARVGIAPRYAITAEGEISHGLSSSGAAGTFLDGDTEIGRVELRLDADLGQEWDAYVRYENTGFSDLANPVTSNARYQWYGVGVSRAMGANAVFSLAYEQSAIRNDYQSSLGLDRLDFRGGFLTSQVTIRF